MKKSNLAVNDAVKAEKSIKMEKIDENKNSARFTFSRSFDSCKFQVFSPTRSVRLRPFFLSCMIFAFQKIEGFCTPAHFISLHFFFRFMFLFFFDSLSLDVTSGFCFAIFVRKSRFFASNLRSYFCFHLMQPNYKFRFSLVAV